MSYTIEDLVVVTEVRPQFRAATPADLLAVLTSMGAEGHDDVELHFVVDGRVIYKRERGDYVVIRKDAFVDTESASL